MANNLVKFYKVASLPSTLVPGAIYFVTTTQSIHVATATDKSDVFGMGLKGATLENSVLTITRHDDTKVTVDFSDIASASSVVTALGTKLNIGASTDAAGTQSYYGLKADIAAAQAAAQGAAKVKDVDTTATNGVNLSVDANGKLDVTVTPGSIAAGNTSVVTGDAVSIAINNVERAAIEAAVGNGADEATDITIYGTRKYVDEKVDAIKIGGGSDNIDLININFDSNTTFDILVTEKLANAVALAETSLQATDKTELQNKIDAINVVGDNQYIEVTAGGTNGDTFTVGLTQEASAKLESAKTTVNAKADGHVQVSVSTGAAGDTVTITENDIASAQALGELSTTVAGHTATINSILGNEDGTDLNSIAELAAWIEEHGTEAAEMAKSIEANAGGITSLNALVGTETVDSRISAAETRATGVANAAQSTADEALAKANAAAEAGVLSFGSHTGVINFDSDGSDEEGHVVFNMLGDKVLRASVNIGATAAQGAKADTAVQTVVEGATNGTIAVDGTEVAVTGLGSAAFTEASAYDAAGAAETAESNAKAYTDVEATGIYKVIEDNEKTTASALTDLDTRLLDIESKKGSIESALQASDITTGSANGTISVKGSDIQVKGLGSAAYTEASAYATAAQGAKADTAYQKPEAGIPLTDLAARVYTQAEVDDMWAWVEF